MVFVAKSWPRRANRLRRLAQNGATASSASYAATAAVEKTMFVGEGDPGSHNLRHFVHAHKGSHRHHGSTASHFIPRPGSPAIVGVLMVVGADLAHQQPRQICFVMLFIELGCP